MNRQFPRPCAGTDPQEKNNDDNAKTGKTKPLNTFEDLMKPDRVDKIREQPNADDRQDNTGKFKPVYAL